MQSFLPAEKKSYHRNRDRSGNTESVASKHRQQGDGQLFILRFIELASKSSSASLRGKLDPTPVDPLLRANWHVNDDDSLCYALDPEWEDCLTDIRSKNPDLFIRSAAFYSVNSARWLLYRHLEGYRRNLEDCQLKNGHAGPILLEVYARITPSAESGGILAYEQPRRA